jgi:hypothetical protein
MGKFKDIAIKQANEEMPITKMPPKEAQNWIAARRGKNARQRGNSFEREVAAKLNGKRVGQYGGKTDVETTVFVVQTKVGNGFFSDRIWKWLKELTPKADQVAVVVVGDAPGPGTRRRAIAVMDLDDLAEWWGKGGTSEL